MATPSSSAPSALDFAAFIEYIRAKLKLLKLDGATVDYVLKWSGAQWVPGTVPGGGTPAAHALVGALHTAAGLTTGHFLKATGATTFAFGAHGLTYADVGALASGGVAVDSAMLNGQSASYYAVAGAAPAAHQLDGALHTVSGLTTGHFLKALSATTFGFAAHGLSYGDVGAAAASHTHAWGDITSGKPTTIGGYGITDFNSLGDARWSPLAGSSSIVTVGALNSGGITSGFGAIDIGADALTCGAITAGAGSSFSAVLTVVDLAGSSIDQLDIDSKAGTAASVRINRSGGTGGFIVFKGSTTTKNLEITDAGVATFAGAASMGALTATTGAFSGAITQGGTAVSLSGHTHAASQVTAGTFASGNFLFQGTVGGITTLTAAQLAGIGTGTPQGSFAYDGSNKLDISVGSTGIITYDAFGSGALHSFLDSILLASGKVITLGSPAATGGSLRLVNGQSIQWRNVGDTNNLGLYLDTSDVFQLGAGLQLTASGFLKIGTVQVVGAQGAAVADATGGAVIDAEARTALNALLARVRTHGAIAT